MKSNIANLEKLEGARKAPMPGFIPPQLATLVKEPPSGDQWLHELKFDGYRMLCHINGDKVRFWSRSEKDWTSKFPNLIDAMAKLGVKNAVIDGEVVIFEPDGRSSFQRLQNAIANAKGRFTFVAFDLIYLNGIDLSRVPLEKRKTVLRELLDSIPKTSPLRYSDHIEGNGELFFTHACKSGIEGIVSKLRNSIYESRRNRSWLKTKCERREEFLIGGYTESSAGLPGFGALILGVYKDDRLVYAGRVGTGFTMKGRVDLQKQLEKYARESSPFEHLPRDPGLRDAHWTDPVLIAEVSFIEWTDEGTLRHPAFHGLRESKRQKN
jgi:bifunctional non-homologous end joining protein LigD